MGGVGETAGRGRIALAAAVCVLGSVLLAPAPAAAHAFLKQSEPASGSVVRTPPTQVRLVFDEAVKPAPGIKVVRAGNRSVVAGRPYQPAGKPNEIVIPLRPGIGAGPYAVTWSEIDVDDGHLISGAFIFTVGAGFAQPVAAGATQGGGSAPLSAMVSRWLLLAGLLVAAGSVAFWLLVRRPVLPEPVAARWDRAQPFVLASALAVATLGALLSVFLQHGEAGTRFGHWTLIGACVAAAGTALALGSARARQLRLPASVVAVVLLGLPTATGHASTTDAPHGVAIPADLIHLVSAAVWVAGVVELGAVAPLVLRALDQPLRRSLHAALVRRFTPAAIVAVAVLGATGIVRAFNELASVHQLWTTGYGQALLVKTGVLAAILALAWLNRIRFRYAGLAVEIGLLAVVIGAVAVLTNVRPGRAQAAATAAPQASTSSTVVFAGQDHDLAVGVGVTPHGGNAVDLRATVLGLNGGVPGLGIRFAIDGRAADAGPCGAGCYSATLPIAGRPGGISVRIAGRGRPAATLRFTGPAHWPAPDGLAIVRRAEQAIDSLHTLVVRSRLASDARHEVTTTYKMVAPDRLAYHNVGSSDSIIIGDRRWDRPKGGRWVESPQVPAIQQPTPFWPPEITDAHVLRTARLGNHSVWVVSFLDPGTPAWFTAWIDRSNDRTLRLDMVAAAHFMHDLNGPFNAPIAVEPPR